MQHVTVRFTVAVAAWGLTATIYKTYSYIRFAQVLPVWLAWWVVRVLSGLHILYTSPLLWRVCPAKVVKEMFFSLSVQRQSVVKEE